MKIEAKIRCREKDCDWQGRGVLEYTKKGKEYIVFKDTAIFSRDQDEQRESLFWGAKIHHMNSRHKMMVVVGDGFQADVWVQGIMVVCLESGKTTIDNDGWLSVPIRRTDIDK